MKLREADVQSREEKMEKRENMLRKEGCEPKNIRESEDILRVEEELKKGRKGEIVGRWCRRLEGDRARASTPQQCRGRRKGTFWVLRKKRPKKCKKKCSPRGERRTGD
jgi:hypothetical protein